MTENNNSIREVKRLHLRSIYKKYTNFILNFQKHTERLDRDWIINTNARHYIMQQLNEMIRQMIKIYNTNLYKIYKGIDLLDPSENDTSDIEDKYYDQIYKKFYNSIDLINIIDDQNFIVESKNDNPFSQIREELIELGCSRGFYSLDDFFSIYINDQYEYMFNSDDNEVFQTYNKIFVPINVSIESYDTYKDDHIDKNCRRSDNIIVTPITINHDILLENTVSIIVYLPKINLTIIFDGYIGSDPLNIYTRTSQINSKFIFNVKTEIEDLLAKSTVYLDPKFKSKYLKFINENSYFIFPPKLFIERIRDHYAKYVSLNSKSLSAIIKQFSNAEIIDMFNIISLLLMGPKQSVSYASALFKILLDKKVNGEILSDVIYHNLSYFAQIKLKKGIINIKSELHRIRSLNVDNIPLEKKLASMTNMPDTAKAYVLEKLAELQTGDNTSKLQMAINGLMQFPWKPKDANNEYGNIRKSMNKSRDYLRSIAKKLDESVYGHESSKKVLIELVGKWIQNPEATGQVIGLVGPPGVGKTLLAKSISNALGIPLAIIGLGGMSDSTDLLGHNFTYAGAQYGMIIRQMIKAGSWRSVMFFDEVDKVAKRNDTSEIYNTLIHITDPNMNQHFQDRFYSSSIDFDLSGVLVVLSYNSSEKLDPILLDRIKEIPISAYSVNEKINIAQSYMLNSLCENIGFDINKIHFDDQTIRYIIEKYTLEAGVRELRRKIEQILLKINIDRFYMRGPFKDLMIKVYETQKERYLERKNRRHKSTKPNVMDLEIDDMSPDNKKTGLSTYLSYHKSKVEDLLDEETLNKVFNLETDFKLVVDTEMVHKYLEKPTMTNEEIHKKDLVGVVNGLYATSIGMGGIIPIHICKNYLGDYTDGVNIKLRLTGNQKLVMRESVICASTTAINMLDKNIILHIMNNFPHGFHVHTPDGGTPKDGPSAGCAFTTAFVSLLLGKKINREIAITGEIELTGKISKIGGLDAKLSGAKRAGVKKVFICEENREDYESIKKKNPELFDDNFKVEIVHHIIEIITNPEVIIGVDEKDFDQDILREYKR